MLTRGALRPLSLQRSGWRQGRPGAASRAVSSAPEAAAGSRLPRPTAEIPGPRRWPLLGSLPALTTRKDWDPKRIHSVWDELSKEFGPVFRLDLPGQGHRIFISDPKDIEHLMKETSYMPTKPLFDVISTVRKQSKNVAEGQTGLLSEQGEEWWRLRRLTQPHTMKVKTVAHYLPEIDLVATEFLDRLPEVLDENNEIPHDFLQELFKWALETIGLTTFSKRIGCLSGSDEGLNLIRTIQSLLKGVHECQLEPGALWRWIPTPAYTKFKAANDALEEYTLAAISDAQLKLEQSDLQNLDLLGQVLLTPGLSKQDVLVFMLDFLIAGIDNVSTTVAFTMLNLAQHPEKQAKMQAELDQALGDGAQVLTPALLNQLSFTKACVRETLRLSPVSVALPRKLEHDVVLGGYLVPKGFEVLVLLKASGTREDAFPRAQEFLPERWLRGEGGRVSSYASLPFGIGTRMCIGKRFAEMEIYALLARMFHRFDVSWHHGAVGTQTRFLLMPDRPLNFTFTKRT
ncbi:probable cytochrome P450 49a1 [Penaeus japonicus]|uniref:probable cytochrome P450 49a1 n=1 Tax=Penaeus japonicus TaxID=27405 RepID=UPI001C7117EB|nr:probable cytochrome P450 49a1 [Penaeus japonicus]XP_042865195.1 probable cytochrome P450 49a1 [Penaeus japonicus]